jgi:uncharacterized protein YndB with AHSA1/START domain
METKVSAETDRPAILISRIFDLPLELLFKAYTDPSLIEQWMGNKVIHLENKAHGSYRFETYDAQGKIIFSAHGVIHTWLPNRSIVRTFEMEHAGFPVQLEFLEFEPCSPTSSQLTMLMLFKSVADRDRMLSLPFAKGINMAHNRLQQIVN